MSPTLDELTALLTLEPIEPGLFRGRQPQTRMQRVFGGQVVGQALMAAGLTVEDKAVHSLHAYFLRAGDLAVPILYSVEATHDGRSFSSRRVVARQHGEVIYVMAASFQVAEEGFEHQDVMPDVGSLRPEDSPSMAGEIGRGPGATREEWAREWEGVDVRLVASTRPDGGIDDAAHPAAARFWIRAAGALPDDPLLHACVLAYFSDLTLIGVALVPHEAEVRERGIVGASLDHAVWFHRPFRADEWLLYDQVSPSASGGRGLTTGRLFTVDGRLVASVAQEGLIRPRTRPG